MDESWGISVLDLSRMVPEWLFLTIKATVAVVCCLVFLPCCVVMIRTEAVHVNCKMVLIASTLTQQLLLLTQVAMFVYDIIIGNLMPETEEQEFWFCMVHEMAYFMTTYLSLLVVIERFVAAKFSAIYEPCRLRTPVVVFLLLLGIVGAGPFAYAIHALNWYFPSIGVMLTAETSIFLFSILLLLYSQKRIKVLPYDRSRLGAKYQLGEVSTFTRAILPPIMVSSVIKTIGLVPPTLWKLGYFGYPYSAMFFFCTHAINCVVVKGLLIICHRGFRKTFDRMICSRKSVDDQDLQEYVPAVTRSNETTVYFQMLSAAWSQPVPKGQQPYVVS
ncbi:hypothetical protein PRIPAC_70384 [Pristionchus pacificus]|uniref:Uncharacterized protein n=1 Tax=Pristionchus pacificus TaxID=54126 RepID=A0A2A6C0M1_PRIPA|nr:hypothetical protein PRIPAC_70384 [Pristionchus pacificus]|eukprot:PDM71802.1 hypothetical protein PRIPAC_38209 [Pristionchus pacificus]